MSCRLDGEPSSTVSTPLAVETGLCKGKRGVVFVAMYMMALLWFICDCYVSGC